MKVFISWSGDVSERVAQCFYDWLPQVLQYTQPYMSTETDKGATWFPVISKELDASEYGIICLTRENLHADWLHFEAGALAHNISKSRVTPVLIDLTTSDVGLPFSQFQFTKFDRSDILKMLKSINSSNKQDSLLEGRLETAFSKWWPDLEANIQRAKEQPQPKEIRRTDRELLEELLQTVRGLSQEGKASSLLSGRFMAIPLRFRVLQYIAENPSASINQLYGAVNAPVENVTRVLQMLLDAEAIEDVRVEGSTKTKRKRTTYSVTQTGLEMLLGLKHSFE